jgi:hypothetical protein
MRKITIMSVAIVTSLVCGEAMMAMVFAFVMISGLMAGCFMSESTRQVVACPASAVSPIERKMHPSAFE